MTTICIEAEAQYYEYNGRAADERRGWTLQHVWAEYDQGHQELRSLVESLAEDKWHGTMLYPWNARGTVQHLIEIMMAHESIEHCSLIQQSIA